MSTEPQFQPRYEPGRYRDCQWCGGRGCAACDGEAEKDYKKAFPNGPQPIATFNIDTPEGMADAKKFMKEMIDTLTQRKTEEPPDADT